MKSVRVLLYCGRFRATVNLRLCPLLELETDAVLLEYFLRA